MAMARLGEGMATAKHSACNMQHHAFACSHPQHATTCIFTQAISRERLQVPAINEVITLNGWLEAPWLPEAKLMLCGLIEGQLPQSLDGDPFLPDSICPALGLSHNEQRLARDAYQLDALLAIHPADGVCLSFSKYNKNN